MGLREEGRKGERERKMRDAVYRRRKKGREGQEVTDERRKRERWKEGDWKRKIR